ncbi:MAG: helix-turn-helix domain-containing protein [Proteobacteria bacterium]|nr:helix-turn-helix domain-containing protein [Pseudomonadota bacterium]
MSEVAARASASFGGLLKSWRATRKISQLDLSLISDVSQRHVSFLESGRARPSQQMVVQLSEALEVPLRDRNALLQAAGFAPYYRHRSLDDLDMSPVRDALSRMLEHHAPYPAIVVDREFNLMMENRPFTNLLGLFADPHDLWQACCANGPPNLLRLTFHPQGARPFIRNFNEIAPLLLQRAWRETLVNGGATHQFINELRNDPTLPTTWHNPDPILTPPPVMPLVIGRGELSLSLFTMISTFGTPRDVTTDEIRVEAFFPADDASESVLRELNATASADPALS